MEYVVAMAKNTVLEAVAAPLLAEARTEAETTGASARVFGETPYQAQTWPHPRRAVIKAEVVVHSGREPRGNPRIVITHLRHRPERLYREIYCARGDSENRLTERHHDLAVGRTSCSRFWANHLRVTLTAAAYVLLQELQLRADRTSLARAQVRPGLREPLTPLPHHFASALVNSPGWIQDLLILGHRVAGSLRPGGRRRDTVSRASKMAPGIRSTAGGSKGRQ